MSAVRPTQVRRLDAEQRLRISWSDGAVTEVAYDVLRGFCPCAACQGHMVREVRYQPPPRPVAITQIEPVGRYALSFAFSDGHATGIYRFDYLRRLEELAAELEHGGGGHGDS